MQEINLSNKGTYFDAVHVNDGFEEDDGLNSAVLLSIFSNRRVTAEEAAEFGVDTQEGYWADTLSDQNDRFGSRLWLLKRSKITPETLNRFKEFTEEALSWLVDDQIARAISVSVERAGLEMIAIKVEIFKPGDKNSQIYSYLWKNI